MITILPLLYLFNNFLFFDCLPLLLLGLVSFVFFSRTSVGVNSLALVPYFNTAILNATCFFML